MHTELKQKEKKTYTREETKRDTKGKRAWFEQPKRYSLAYEICIYPSKSKKKK